MATYSRSMVVSYLHSLTALEFGAYRLKREINSCEYHINNLGVPKRIAEPKPKGEGTGCGFTLGMAVVGLIFPIGGWVIDDLVSIVSKTSTCTTIGWTIYVILLVIGIIVGFSSQSKLKSESNYEQQEYLRAVENDRRRVNKELKQRQDLLKYSRSLKAEYNRIVNVKTKLYNDYSLVPSDFRNPYGVYELYKYMSSSQESLSSAINHCDHKIIQQQLDKIMEQNNEIILNQYIQQAQNNQLLSMGRKNAAALKNIEHYAKQTASDARIAASNSEASRCLLEAQYLHNLLR